MSEYPKWKYHKDDEPVLVHDDSQENALGKGWCDDPNEAKGIKKAPPPAKSAGDLANKLHTATEELKKVEALNEELVAQNAELEKQLEEAEDHIETLEAALEEASKNDHRDEDGKFKKADDDENPDDPDGDEDPEGEEGGDDKEKKGFDKDKKAKTPKKK